MSCSQEPSRIASAWATGGVNPIPLALLRSPQLSSRFVAPHPFHLWTASPQHPTPVLSALAVPYSHRLTTAPSPSNSTATVRLAIVPHPRLPIPGSTRTTRDAPHACTPGRPGPAASRSPAGSETPPRRRAALAVQPPARQILRHGPLVRDLDVLVGFVPIDCPIAPQPRDLHQLVPRGRRRRRLRPCILSGHLSPECSGVGGRSRSQRATPLPPAPPDFATQETYCVMLIVQAPSASTSSRYHPPCTLLTARPCQVPISFASRATRAPLVTS